MKSIIDDVYRIGTEAWRESGNDAAQDGKVAEIRQKLMRAREELRLLQSLHKKFEEVKQPLTDFRKSVDEELDEQGDPVSTIDDFNRLARREWPVIGMAPKATRLRQKLNDVFAHIYG